MTGGSDYLRGVVSLGSASLFIAAANVAFGNAVQDIKPVTVAFIAFIVAALVFTALNRGRGLPSGGRQAIIGLNLASAGVFLFLYTGLEYLEPAVASALQAGATPLVTILVTRVGRRRTGPSAPGHAASAPWAGAALIILGSAGLAWVSITGRSGLPGADVRSTVIGTVAVLASGICTVVLTLCVKRLTVIGWANREILAHRFYATVVGCGLLSLATERRWDTVAGDLPWLAVISLIGVTLPLLLLQIGIRLVVPVVVLAMTNLNPVLTWVIELADSRLTTSAYTLAGILVVLSGVGWIVRTQAAPAHPGQVPRDQTQETTQWAPWDSNPQPTDLS